VTPLALVLVIAVVLYLVIAGVSRRERARLGLGDGEVVAADDTRVGAPTLYSERLGLAGRPDHLLEWDGVLIPVEQKPRSRRLQPSHVLHVAAQCVLVEEVYGVRPPYGVVVLAGGARVRWPAPRTARAGHCFRWRCCRRPPGPSSSTGRRRAAGAVRARSRRA
jgi:CRISPR-associated exonuclease Cas4